MAAALRPHAPAALMCSAAAAAALRSPGVPSLAPAPGALRRPCRSGPRWPQRGSTSQPRWRPRGRSSHSAAAPSEQEAAEEDSPAERRRRAREGAVHAANLAQTTLQEELNPDPQETGFVLVGEPTTHPITPTFEPEDADPSDFNPHYEDYKLVERLRGTPGFKEEMVKDLLPLVRRDPTLLEDMQDFELASKFQEIAHNPKDAPNIVRSNEKLRRVVEKIQRLRADHLHSEQQPE
eukprot:TRINITY_DN26408_c0_g1_i1.p2 TRINITY_DN26408_c0_g1~~TRINITY_DN26408_c0_g1_i1.p2  ORF type:complete len:265 (+),score=72.01 TRINITY_DN26408_c0_g1_i1:90-797(+)